MNNANLGFNQFSINRPQYGTKDFLQSNSFVAKFAYLLMVLFVFIILLRLGVSLLGWSFQRNYSPHLFDGMINGKQMVTFVQDPESKNPKGVEFTPPSLAGSPQAASRNRCRIRRL